MAGHGDYYSLWPIEFSDKPTDVQKTIRESYTVHNKQTEEPSIVGNHLSIPKPMDMNPNLLSPEILGQRRGSVQTNNNNCKRLNA